ADLPENYEGHPAFRFIEEVPVTWDETRVLDAEIGDFVITARRAGRSWFVGGLTDERARVFLVPLDFLEEGTAYTARIYADASEADWDTNPLGYTIEERAVDAGTVLTMRFAPGGGQAVSIEPAGKWK
ncbi:MAG TPA: glycoside hydrolase family 97 protein, partial [Candidatus Eisenbacteria bacterium]|nr:glycoside hydrolase family 97 protein [Candidatus Eisenbacteria bacterium]